MRSLKLLPVVIVAVASFVLAIASVTVVLDGGAEACQGRQGPSAPRSGETVRRETSWLPPGTRCVYTAAGRGAVRTVEPSPLIFVVNLGLGALLGLLLKSRVVDQMRQRRGIR